MNDKLLNYLFDVIGIQINLNKLEKSVLYNIPDFLVNTYDFFETEIFEKDIILIYQKTDSKFTTGQYKIHTQIIEKTLDKPVVLVLDKIESYNRLRLIKQKINFIIIGKQIFLPFLFLDINNFTTKKNYNNRCFTPATQALLLYHLQKENLNGIGISAIADKLHYTTITISRAFKELTEKNICLTIGSKNIFINFPDDKKELWKKILPYLKSPVNKIFFTDKLPENIPTYITGITALSYYTEIADDGRKHIAISKQDYIKNINEIKKNIINSEEADYKVEVWNYDPEILTTHENYVDALSLYLTFKDSEDERIQIETEKLLKKYFVKAKKD
jgi:DNA-binding MarR family transcriptional regulator